MANLRKFKASKTAYLGHVTRALDSLDEELSKDATANRETLTQLVEKI